MENQKVTFPIDHRLESAITVRKRRNGKVSMCFNLDDLEIIKLKMFGNKIVTCFSEEPNSIIVGKNVPAGVIKKINEYALAHPYVNIEDVDTLYN